MNFSEFVERVVEEIKDYLPEEYAEADIDIVNIAKENFNYKGLNIHKGNERITPTLNLDAFYEAYEETGDFEEILEKIAELRIETDKNKPLINYEDITKWENVKNNVVPALMNLDLNEELLKNLVHEKLGDMAIFYRIVFDINDGVGITKVTHQILEMWGITGKELYEQAIANLDLYPAKLLSYEDFMREHMGIENPPKINSGFLIIGDDVRGASGAGNVLSSKNCDKVAKYFGCKDIVLIPSSKHEMLALPLDAEADQWTVKKMIEETNSTAVAHEDILSWVPYIYSTRTKEITVYGDWE